MNKRMSICAMLGLFLSVAAGTPALADKIDGTWCSPVGETMQIQGTRIVTPGGAVVVGRYDRHKVDYEIPAGERYAGGRIYAEQLNNQRIRVTVIKKVQLEPGQHDDWTRCDPIS